MGTVPQGPIGPLTALLRSRHLKRLAAWFVATLVICASLVGITLFRAYGDLSAGRQGLLDARKALSAGNLSEALDRFDRAGERFDLARRKTGGPLGGLAGVIPLLGNDVDVAAALAEGGVLLSGAGAEVTTAISKLPDGFGSLAPANGRFPLEMYTEVGHVLSAARQDAQTALDKVLASPSSFLTGPVLEARWEAESQMREVVTALEATESMLSGLPRFAGADGERTYLVLAQNPAELRGTGGIWGAYALMSLVDGRPRFGSVAPTQSLPDVSSEQVPAPSADYARNYDGFGGAASWHNMNMTPDFPSAAQAAMANYEAATGTPVDGVIAADPFALREMLEVTGPISVPGLDRRIDADNVIPFTTNEAYSLFRGPALRKEVLGEVVKDVVARFLAIEGKGVARMKALSEAFSGGHLLVYSTDAEFQRGLALAGGGGGRPPPGRGGGPGPRRPPRPQLRSPRPGRRHGQQRIREQDRLLRPSPRRLQRHIGRGRRGARLPRDDHPQPGAGLGRAPLRHRSVREGRRGRRPDLVHLCLVPRPVRAAGRLARRPPRDPGTGKRVGHPLVPGLPDHRRRTGGVFGRGVEDQRRLGRELVGRRVPADVLGSDHHPAHGGSDLDRGTGRDAGPLDQRTHGHRRRHRRVGRHGDGRPGA